MTNTPIYAFIGWDYDVGVDEWATDRRWWIDVTLTGRDMAPRAWEPVQC